jgi:hypothetical protein
VGPHGDVDLPRGDPLERLASRARRQTALELEQLHPRVGQVAPERGVVLLGEDLGRGHERGLPATRHRGQDRVDGHRRLPGPDVALEEAVHRARGPHVGRDLLDAALLRSGEREGIQAPDPRVDPGVDPERDPGLPPPPPLAPQGQHELQEEELVVLEPALRGGEVLPGLREVDELESPAERQEAARPAEVVGERVLDRGESRVERAPHDAPEPARGQPLRERVDRDDPVQVEQLRVVVPLLDRLALRDGHLEAPLRGHLAVQEDPVPHRELLAPPRLGSRRPPRALRCRRPPRRGRRRDRAGSAGPRRAGPCRARSPSLRSGASRSSGGRVDPRSDGARGTAGRGPSPRPAGRARTRGGAPLP